MSQTAPSTAPAGHAPTDPTRTTLLATPDSASALVAARLTTPETDPPAWPATSKPAVGLAVSTRTVAPGPSAEPPLRSVARIVKQYAPSLRPATLNEPAELLRPAMGTAADVGAAHGPDACRTVCETLSTSKAGVQRSETGSAYGVPATCGAPGAVTARALAGHAAHSAAATATIVDRRAMPDVPPEPPEAAALQPARPAYAAREELPRWSSTALPGLSVWGGRGTPLASPGPTRAHVARRFLGERRIVHRQRAGLAPRGSPTSCRRRAGSTHPGRCDRSHLRG